MNKIAAIDLGTNSMRLLLCEVENGVFLKKNKEVVTTRIGKNLSKSGAMSKESMKLNIEALKSLKNEAQTYGAEEIITIATSAVRDAVNKVDFLYDVKKETGLEIKVLSGNEEAIVGMLGVTYGLPENENILIADVGGGSTEIVLSRNKKIKFSQSIDAGAVRMTERFLMSDPIQDKDIKNLKENLLRLFSYSTDKLSNTELNKVIAIGGTASTAAAIFLGMELYNPGRIHNTILELSFLTGLFDKLKSMTVEERYQIKGLEKERADIIPAGIYILIFIIEALGIKKIIVSDNDNLEGAIIKYSKIFD